MLTTNRFFKSIICFLAFVIFSFKAVADSSGSDKIYFSGNLYGTHVNLMPYKGYQDDLSFTAALKFSEAPISLFTRYLSTNYYYLNDTLISNTNYTSDQRTALGLGLDIKVNDIITFRVISEQIKNKLANESFSQISYGIIYNQFMDLKLFEMSNYLESFYIPRISTTIDTYLKIQALKSYYLQQSSKSSNAIYPTVQIKAKYNDDSRFGISGQNLSFGGGYKYFSRYDKSNFSILVEGHSVVYQSRDFNGDWLQLFAAIQWLIN